MFHLLHNIFIIITFVVTLDKYYSESHLDKILFFKKHYCTFLSNHARRKQDFGTLQLFRQMREISKKFNYIFV